MLIKDLFTYSACGLLTICMTASCRSLRSGTALPSREASARPAARSAEPAKRIYKGGVQQSTRNNPNLLIANPYLNISTDIEKTEDIQFKYAVYMDVPVELLTNYELLRFLDEWYGVPYRYGGSTKKGIDCSAFSAEMMHVVFGTQMPRTAKEQYLLCTPLTKEELREGDLVFFNTSGGISHVGIFLMNNKFVHASTSNGVMISDLDEAYFTKRFLGGGRLIL
jgi:hypothetical protein